MSDKEIRSDAKLKNLPQEALNELWLMRHPADGEKKLKYLEVQVEVPLRYGFTVSVSSLSDLYKWLRQKRRMEAARHRAEQAKRQLLDQHPDASADELEELGQMIFTSETVEDGDIKGFVSLMKAKNARRKLKLEERRIKLLEEKAQKADAIEAIMQDRANNGGGLSDETLALIEQKLGM